MNFTCLSRGVFRSVPFHLAALQLGILFAAAPNPDEIVRRSVEAIQSDWAQAPKYSYVERDVVTKHRSVRTSKTYRVLMIDGSPYNVVTALNDEPLTTGQKAAEQWKLQMEIQKRQTESDRERRRRIAKYNKEQQHDHQMLQEMMQAFQFHMAGEAQVNGHFCWILDTKPNPEYDPSDHEGRVLKGMQGRLWIDKASNQWVRVRAQVVKPVSFFGFLAKVGPGTEFQLEQEPVGDNVWMPVRFNVRVNATALGFFDENSTESDTYQDYRPMPQASALLQSTK
ncbi:MAG TPA: hypothetical protein VME17_21855 [Bryobacteraceae bacterium]|nr:hypothetical protein [Bryobacteraceae bacterium]